MSRLGATITRPGGVGSIQSGLLGLEVGTGFFDSRVVALHPIVGFLGISQEAFYYGAGLLLPTGYLQ